MIGGETYPGDGAVVDELISAEAIRTRVKELGRQISDDYANRKPVVIGVLLGAVVFVADLMRHVTVPLELGFMEVRSYGGGTVSSGRVEIVKGLRRRIAGEDVLLVEDIVDSGRTLATIRKVVLAGNPRTLATCTLLSKPARRVCTVPLEYCGFTIEDRFVVGYGMDYKERYRNLDYIGVVNT